MVSKSNKVGHNKLVGRQRLMTPLDTLIVWTEPTNGVDMALSFQESEGCAAIWSVLDLRCWKRIRANTSGIVGSL